MKLQLFNVAPSIPDELRFLETLAGNMWWSWSTAATDLFRRIDSQIWTETDHNPRGLLSRVPQKRLESLASDEGFLEHLREVKERFERSVADVSARTAQNGSRGCVAYFSLEYGIHESVRIYSGGLGVLAGDHLKAASDLELPIVAVGLLYRQGYFQQYLTSDGYQQEHYPEHEIQLLPVEKACDAKGEQIQIHLPLPNGVLKALVWRLDIGSIPLYLLDANLPDNPPEVRNITAQLYAVDRTLRLRQELLLGIGGFDALHALGYQPHVCHMNEGHAAFLGVARVAHLMQERQIDMHTALEIVPRTTVFTTHTPVPAGNEMFYLDLVTPHLQCLEIKLGMEAKTIMEWAQSPGNPNHEISMTILGLRLAHQSNGVSELHGSVARRMWAHLWPGRPEAEVPISHVTNGVHVPSWLSPENETLFDRYLGPGWRAKPAAPKVMTGLMHIPDEELWRAHEIGRSKLIRFVRERLEKQFSARNATRAEISQLKGVLEHDALTIGFARRFATYKRATLLLSDPKRLEALLTNEDRPVQIIFAGKAHPADEHGKDLIRQIFHFARRPAIRRRVVFLENYDINVARHLVQGVDVWLNTPRRPLEASGTSGMKASVNGVLQVSSLDGWWCEGYSPECGWAIGHGEEYQDTAYQDSVESHALYNLLEDEIVPAFYERSAGEIPLQWTKMMKASMKMSMGFFSSHRMVAEYHKRFYEPALAAYDELTADGAAKARRLVTQRERLQTLWNQVRIETAATADGPTSLHVGDKLRITTHVMLGELTPEEVDVEVYYGPVDPQNVIRKYHIDKMSIAEKRPDGSYLFEKEVTCPAAGRYGFTTRVTPQGRDWRMHMPGFITWADGT